MLPNAAPGAAGLRPGWCNRDAGATEPHEGESIPSPSATEPRYPLAKKASRCYNAHMDNSARDPWELLCDAQGVPLCDALRDALLAPLGRNVLGGDLAHAALEESIHDE